jgi:putative LysE/RhtB family amino acid efflux pump
MPASLLPAFATGVGLGALVAAQVGPVSLLCIRTTLRYGPAPGLAVGAGAATVDTTYGALGMVGAGALVSVEPVRWTMGAIGAVVLVVMGVRTLWAAQRVRSGLEVPSEVVTPGRALRTSLAATASNPLTIASWATAFAAASTASVIGGWADGTALLCGIGAGSLGWFVVLTGGVALAGRRLGDRSLQAADTVAGLGLVGFGALLGLRTVREG